MDQKMTDLGLCDLPNHSGTKIEGSVNQLAIRLHTLTEHLGRLFEGLQPVVSCGMVQPIVPNEAASPLLTVRLEHLAGHVELLSKLVCNARMELYPPTPEDSNVGSVPIQGNPMQARQVFAGGAIPEPCAGKPVGFNEVRGKVFQR